MEQELAQRQQRPGRKQVGLEEVDDGIWSLFFGTVLLGRFDERWFKLYAAKPYHRQSKEMGKTAKLRNS